MNPHALPLATAYPSEGIPDELHAAFWVIYTIAVVVAVGGVVMRFQTGWDSATERKLAVVAILVGLIPLIWHLHIYRIDFVPSYQDVTPASSPIWMAMAIPMLPILCGCFLLLLRRRIRISVHPQG